MDWNDYPNFSKSEFDCKQTGDNKMRPEFMDLLQDIRNEWGKPIYINSGYRSPYHSVEAKKNRPGTHTHGIAADIKISGPDVAKFIALCYSLGVRRFGLQQKGPFSSRFIHIDIGDRILKAPQSTWSY